MNSGAQVAEALRQAGHAVIEHDIMPDDLSALDETFDVVFPVLHGRWGEGGPLQAILEQRGLAFVGTGSVAAMGAMDKLAAKAVLDEYGIATPPAEALAFGSRPTLRAPLVIKPIDEGSSVGVHLCRDDNAIEATLASMTDASHVLMAERLIEGREMTVGIVGDAALPVIEIVPTVAFYDYDAKYDRDDTQYRFDIDLPDATLRHMQADALAFHHALGVRHLSRVDFIVDANGEAWALEINTMPGFTTHSLLPMAAREHGLAMPALCDRLVWLAHQDGPCR